MISSPLRYPGGKAKLFDFVAAVIVANDLVGCEYCEPYAGGAGLAIRLLTTGLVANISINDLDPAIHAFWTSALGDTDAFCALIDATPITIEEWRRQREVWREGDSSDPLRLGFAAYFLNRTNRSGIIDGAGPIGGYSQSGPWKLDARLVKQRQIDNIKTLSVFKTQIAVTNYDALHFINLKLRNERALIYADPPYFVKGSKLYRNFYDVKDHIEVKDLLSLFRDKNWIVSYDDVPEIRWIYRDFSPTTYSLNYSAGTKGIGSEVIYGSDALRLPETEGYVRAA